MYGLRITGEPSDEPLTTDEVKRHLNLALAVTIHDSYIGSLITAARKYVEDQLNRSLLSTQWEITLDSLPCEREIYLPRAPLLTVDEITYIATDGTETTWASTNYIVSTTREPARLSLAYGCVWPSIQYRADAVTILFTAGYGDDATDVPYPIRQALLLIIGHWFENRETVGPVNLKEVPMAATHLIQAYRVGDEFTCYAA